MVLFTLQHIEWHYFAQLLLFEKLYVPLLRDRCTMRHTHRHSKNGIASKTWIALVASLVILLSACRHDSTPRPSGYFRIDPYPASYSATHIGNLSLQINDSARCITPDATTSQGVHWLNIVYPRYNATIYLSYIPLQNNLAQLMAESIELVYRQNVNTDQVEAVAYEDKEAHLYATLFTLSAESATPIQFIATDSIQYLLRGALYFDNAVKSDSVAPSLHYIEEDIMYLIESVSTITQ